MMSRARSNHSDTIASLKRILAEKEALLAEKEALLLERERVIAVRDAELYAKTLQIERMKAQLAVLRRARFGRSSERLDRELPEDLEDLVMRALRKNPDERYPSAAEFAVALSRCAVAGKWIYRDDSIPAAKIASMPSLPASGAIIRPLRSSERVRAVEDAPLRITSTETPHSG